jgi:hypothetical protein
MLHKQVFESVVQIAWEVFSTNVSLSPLLIVNFKDTARVVAVVKFRRALGATVL